MTDAAAQAGIHRNTIANWQRISPDFREALAVTRHDRALLYRDRAVELADLAFETLRSVLTDPKSSPSTRLRAALYIIDKVSTPPKFENEEPANLDDMLAAMEEAAQPHLAQQQPPEPANDAQNCTTMHNDAQPEPASQMHNFAQPPETYRLSLIHISYRTSAAGPPRRMAPRWNPCWPPKGCIHRASARPPIW